LSTPTSRGRSVDNASGLKFRGVDIASALLAGSWRYYASADYSGAKFNNGVEVLNVDVGHDVSVGGLRPKKAPEWSGTAGVEYNIRATTLKGQLVARADVYFSSRTFLSYTPINDLAGRRQDIQGGYATNNLHLTYKHGSGWCEVEGYVNNLWDRTVRVGYSPIDNGFARLNYAPPRTYGIRIDAKF
jgi:hypothetical protein